MWNRIQTAANTTTTTLIQTPAELLPRHNKRHRTRPRRRFDLDSDSDDNHRSETPDLDPDKQFWQESFDGRLNDLAVASNVPYRYEIFRGKTVPSPSHTPLGSYDHLPGLSSDVNTKAQPPRNPPRRFQDESGWRPTDGSSDENLPRAKHSRHESEAPPAISRSTATPSPLGKMYTYGHRNTDAQGVSPPSSPEMNPARPRNLDHDVSPIDDDVDMSQQRILRCPRPVQASTSLPGQSRIPPPQAHSRQASGQQPKSSIPMMRRERRKQQDATPAAAKPSRPYQREQGRQTPPVTSPNPHHNAMGWQDPAGGRLTPTHGLPIDEDLGYGVSTTITSQSSRQSQTPSPSFGHRIRQFGRSKPEPIESRPAWNGAGGRQALVEPVRENKNVAPLNIPPKSSRRAERTQDTQAHRNTPTNPQGAETAPGSSAGATVRKVVPSRSGQTPEPKLAGTEPATHNAAQHAQAYPSPPTHSSPAPQASGPSNTPPAPLAIPDPGKAIKRKPPPAGQAQAPSHTVHPSTSSSIYSTQPDGLGLTTSPHPITTTSPNPPASDEGWVQPSSRFSITTYATSVAGSPRQCQEEDRPPVPEVPSVMDRRRPVGGIDSPEATGDEPLVISLKSASVSSPITGLERERGHPPRAAADIKKSERSASISSTSKALPPAPPEMVESKDRVVLLNAKLEGLAHRRNNINRSIKQMTELMPADRLLESAEVMQKREEEKKKVEKLREELAEIQQQEYDLGLKLHRAYKRQDRDADYESGTLWVRRFTE